MLGFIGFGLGAQVTRTGLRRARRTLERRKPWPLLGSPALDPAMGLREKLHSTRYGTKRNGQSLEYAGEPLSSIGYAGLSVLLVAAPALQTEYAFCKDL